MAKPAMSPQAPGVQLQDQVLVARTEGVQVFRRGERVLVIEPQTASWTVMDPASWAVYVCLDRPKLLANLYRDLPELQPGFVSSVVEQLHRLGMVGLNGRPFHDLASLWPDHEPLGPRFLALHVTEACNFACSYCYNCSGGGPGATMTLDLGRRILEKAFRELPAPHLSFDFMGGEPLLAFETILELMAHGRELEQKHQKAASFLMQTNGSLLTPERVRCLRDFQVGVGVSLDGPAEIHDRNRCLSGGRGTHHTVLNNLLRARDQGLRVTPLAVVERPSDYTRVLDYLVGDLGFEFLHLNPCSSLGRARETRPPGPERAEAHHHGFMAMLERAWHHSRKRGRPLVINSLSSMLANLVSKRRDLMCMRSPCGLGDAILSFSVQGEVLACEEYEPSTKGTFYLGQLEDLDLGRLALDSAKVQTLRQRRVENIPRCSRCPIRRFCGGGCAHKALAWSGELLREDPMCRFYELTFIELMWKIADEPEIVPALGGCRNASS
jgi:uncharacterized protein